jgi:hypothetical protein
VSSEPVAALTERPSDKTETTDIRVLPARRLRVLISLLHAGYLRHYGEPIQLLASRGHRVHLILLREEKDPGDAMLVAKLAGSSPNITWEIAPTRRYVDGWRRIAWLIRAYGDLARYAHPRYRDAVALRGRIAEKIEFHVRAHRFDPVSKRALLDLTRRLTTVSDIDLSDRWIAICQRLEQAVPASRRLTRFVARQCPDAVIASPLVEFGSPQLEYLKVARKLGIRTGVCIASWDNLTNKGLMRIVPDRVIVWNEVQRREAEELHGVPRDRIVTTGAQRWDPWFERAPSTSREEFALQVGLDPSQPFLLYLCSSVFIAMYEVDFVRRWGAELRASGDERLRSIGILVRPHPQNGNQWRSVDLAELGNATVWPPLGAPPDEGPARDGYYDSLAHSAAVVGINTSSMIESGILGKRVFTILDPEFTTTQVGTLHFHYLLHENGGFVRVARNLDEHVEQLGAELSGGKLDLAQTRRFIASFVRPHGLDQPAAPLVADAIEELASLSRPEPLRPRLSDLALRAVLAPVAAALTVGACGTWLGRRLRPPFEERRVARFAPSTVRQRMRRLERTRRWA